MRLKSKATHIWSDFRASLRVLLNLLHYIDFMKHALGLFFFLFFTAATCVAQNIDVCDLKSNEAPDLFNLRLGMSPEEVQTVFRRDLKIKIKKNGNKVFFQNFIEKPAPPVLSGGRALYLRFFDRRLYAVEIFLEDRPEIKTVEDF